MGWISPDGKIRKDILEQGMWGAKPCENSKCTITILEYPLFNDINNTIITIGDNDGELWRYIEICLTTMFVGEKSKFFIKLSNEDISLDIKLLDLFFDGYIYEWDAIKKVNLATHHKEAGNNLFRLKNNQNAAYRFIKALKILHSIPIDAEQPLDIIQGIPVSRINSLKENLYNNLSSCYFKNQLWDKVVDLCEKVLSYNLNNIKAWYRLGIAYENVKNFEKAFEAFSKVLELEPNNKACTEHLTVVTFELKKAEIRVNDMVKKMFAT